MWLSCVNCEIAQCGRNNWFYFIESNCLVIVGTVSYHRCKINHFNSWDNSESPHHFVQQQQQHVIENLQFNLMSLPLFFWTALCCRSYVCGGVLWSCDFKHLTMTLNIAIPQLENMCCIQDSRGVTAWHGGIVISRLDTP